MTICYFCNEEIKPDDLLGSHQEFKNGETVYICSECLMDEQKYSDWMHICSEDL